MAGFYFHIPFCRQACRYCDFYFTVSTKYKDDVVKAMIKEIAERSSEYSQEKFSTLYFGGGTPSVLTIKDLDLLLDAVFDKYHFTGDPEFTFEANPDDLTPEYLNQLKSRGINRLSIGVQSFREQDLELMHRSHNAAQALKAIDAARDAGIDNLSIDLIYGIPGMTTGDFTDNIAKALSMNIPHLSAYHLTFEPGTVFDHWRKKGRLLPVDEEESLRQFKRLRALTGEKNYQHYEISNFALDGFYSKHNLSYWKQVPYIGIGPSAHSYLGKFRRWNISSNKDYIRGLLQNQGKYFDYEELTLDNLFNEFILTSLRTMWGIDMVRLRERFGDNYVKYTTKLAEKFFTSGMLLKNGDKIYLSENGLFAADYVMSEFFLVDE